MMFKKKTGLAAAPKNANAYAQQIDAWLSGRSFDEKARLVAAVKTGGDVEARVRFLKDGKQQFSLWLMVRDGDEGIRLIPEPEGAQGGPA